MSFSKFFILKGMKLLNLADPGCQVYIQKTGEYIVAAQGELHLKRCLGELTKNFAKVELTVSPPLVAFKVQICRYSLVLI